MHSAAAGVFLSRVCISVLWGWPLSLQPRVRPYQCCLRKFHMFSFSIRQRVQLPQRVSMFQPLYFGGKHIFLAELSFLCGEGLSLYRAGNQPEDCMAVGPLHSFFQTADHRHSHFTMVTCFIPSEFLAPAVQDSWHSIYLAKQFEHAEQLLFILHSVLWRKALCTENMVWEYADEMHCFFLNDQYQSLLTDLYCACRSLFFHQRLLDFGTETASVVFY